MELNLRRAEGRSGTLVWRATEAAFIRLFWRAAVYQSKLPEANIPLRALEGWVTREDVLSVGVRSMRFGKIRLERPRM